MVDYALHEKAYIDVCKHYRQIYDSKTVKEDQAKLSEVTLEAMFCARRCILTPLSVAAKDPAQRRLFHHPFSLRQ